jgi:RNA polymerase sigma factor (sigma-70 family)
MADVTDQNLIRAYVRGRCEQSFGELVHRHVDLVHSTALRVVRDASLAEDVTQRVFLTLAKHSVNLQERSSLTGWLHETARNLAINTVRGEERRRQREQEAAAMSNLESNESDAVWKQIAPHLDEAIAQLNSVEREVILWRYFERRTAEQIGGRLGLTPEAAQKRVARALDRLRGILAEGGLTVPTASLTVLLSTQAVQSAPVGLAASAITAVSATSAILPATSTLQIIMASTNAKIGLAVVLAASVTTPLVLQHQTNSRLRDEIARLRAEPAPPPRVQAAPSDTAELERLRREHEELLRLRGQVALLRQQAANPPKVQKEKANSLLAESPESRMLRLNPWMDPAVSPEIPMIGSNSWGNAGLATPAAALQTITWALANRDTNTMLAAVGMDPKTREMEEERFSRLPEAVREKYGSLDALLIALQFKNPPSATGFRILSQTEDGPDDVTLVVQQQFADGRVGGGWTRLYRDENGSWRSVVPPLPEGMWEHIVDSASGRQPSTGPLPITQQTPR